MSLKVITPGGSGLGTPPAENTAVSALNTIEADHFWELSETSGNWADSGDVGGWPLLYETTGGNRDPAMRGVVGRIRGEPKVRAIATDARGVEVRTADVFATRIETSTGSVGAWMGWTSPQGANNTTSTSAKPFIGHNIVQTTSRAFWRFGLLGNGSVFMRLWTPGDAWLAEWIWDDATTVQNLQKESGSDTWVTGGKMHHYVVVQRGDGNGPQLYINGSLITAAPTTSFTGTGADDDAWWDTLAANRSGGTQAFYQLGQNARWQLPFIKSAALTAQEVTDIYTAASPSGSCGDLHEWIQAWEPDFWKPPNSMPGTDPVQDQQGIWVEKNVGNASATEFIDFRFSRGLSSWGIGGELISAADWPGVGYNVRGVESPPAASQSYNFISGGGAAVNDQPWSLKWTAANGFNTGTIGMILQRPTNGQRMWRFESETADQYFEMTMGVGQWIFRLQNGASNFWQVNWDYPVVGGVTGFLVITQNGTPGAGVDVYWNGILQDGANIGGSQGGSYDGSEWFSDLTAGGDWRILFPPNRSTFNSLWFTGQIYDMWIKRGPPLTATQIFNLYSLAVGDITALAPP